MKNIKYQTRIIENKLKMKKDILDGILKNFMYKKTVFRYEYYLMLKKHLQLAATNKIFRIDESLW